jgi:membrane peptidoglycan carboxypeptidase
VLSSVLPIEWVEQLNVNFRGTAQPLITLVGERTQLAQLRLRLRGIVERCRVASVLVPWAKTGINLVQNGQRLPVSSTADVDVLNQRFTKVIDPTYTDGARIRVGPGTSQYTPISALPAYVSAIMFLSEEVDFHKNLAVDLGLIQRALGLDLSHGRYVYGGSTITQQLVKNLILDRRKTLRRKFHEMLIADRVYQRVPKERVLELYVNVIEFGPGIFGIEAAAEFYFQKPASELSINESIFLAMLKPDPTRGVAYVRRGRTPLHEYWFTRSEQLLGRLVEYGYVLGNKAQDLPPLELFWSAGDSVAKPTEK